MSQLRLCAVIFGCWAGLFFVFPGWSNAVSALGYTHSPHAEDWTQIVGLSCLGFAVLLMEADRAQHPAVARVIARGVLAFALPCALLVAYWQIIPERRWFRLDLLSVAFLLFISFVCSRLVTGASRAERGPRDSKPAG